LSCHGSRLQPWPSRSWSRRTLRTVALEATFLSVAILGLLVLIRTFLSWALVVEIEGRWPWQPPREE